jgi:hypothetical protein
MLTLTRFFLFGLLLCLPVHKLLLVQAQEEVQECHSKDAAAAEAIEIDPTCPDRAHLMRCAAVHLDTNQNGKLDRDELQKAIDKLPWLARGVLQILGSVDKMMKKCDVDGDDAISMDYDMEHNHETCLATCLKRRVFKSAFFPDCDA